MSAPKKPQPHERIEPPRTAQAAVRAQSAPKVVAVRGGAALPARVEPKAPQPYRPQPTPVVLQTKTHGPSQSRDIHTRPLASPSSPSQPLANAPTPPAFARGAQSEAKPHARPTDPRLNARPSSARGPSTAVGSTTRNVAASPRSGTSAVQAKRHAPAAPPRYMPQPHVAPQARTADRSTPFPVGRHAFGRGPSIVQRSRALVSAASRKPDWAEDEDLSGQGQGSCGATIYFPGGDIDGEYSADTGFHAEMDALNQFLGYGGELGDITGITLSSPPCKVCKTILNVLGLGALVSVPPGKGNKTGHKSAFAVPNSVKNLVAGRLGIKVEKVMEYLDAL